MRPSVLSTGSIAVGWLHIANEWHSYATELKAPECSRGPPSIYLALFCDTKKAQATVRFESRFGTKMRFIFSTNNQNNDNNM